MSEASEAPKPAAAAEAPSPKKPAAPPRPLPSLEEIAAWVKGDDLPTLAALFDQLVLAKFDVLVMQIRKEELLPQHWQVITHRAIPDEGAFDRLPAVARLRERYGDGELAERRVTALRTAWIELGGRQPLLWTVPDLFAALRRIIDRKLEVDFHDLLSAARDVWAGQKLPQGKEQLEILWACLAFIRGKTKK